MNFPGERPVSLDDFVRGDVSENANYSVQNEDDQDYFDRERATVLVRAAPKVQEVR